MVTHLFVFVVYVCSSVCFRVVIAFSFPMVGLPPPPSGVTFRHNPTHRESIKDSGPLGSNSRRTTIHFKHNHEFSILCMWMRNPQLTIVSLIFYDTWWMPEIWRLNEKPQTENHYSSIQQWFYHTCIKKWQVLAMVSHSMSGFFDLPVTKLRRNLS